MYRLLLLLRSHKTSTGPGVELQGSGLLCLPHRGAAICLFSVLCRPIGPLRPTPRAAHTHAKTCHSTPKWVSHGCVHIEVHVSHHDHGWGPTPNMYWYLVQNVVKAVRDALAHAVWLRGETVRDLWPPSGDEKTGRCQVRARIAWCGLSPRFLQHSLTDECCKGLPRLRLGLEWK